MGEAEHLPMTLNPIFLPTSMGTYAEGDPFLAKLQEIDSDIQKFDHVPCEKVGDLEGQIGSQLQKDESCQSRGTVRLEDAADSSLRAKADCKKGLVGPGRTEKDGVGLGPKKEGKKGQWTRLLSRISSELMEEAPYGSEGPKRKIREDQDRVEANTVKEKKQKTGEVAEKQSTMVTTSIGSAEVAEQLRREL